MKFDELVRILTEKNEDLVSIVSSSKAIVDRRLASFGIKDKITIRIKNLRTKRQQDWLALYRSQTQFRSNPIFWVNADFIEIEKNIVGETESNPIQVLVDTLFHEYGHVVWEFFFWHGWNNFEEGEEIGKVKNYIKEVYNNQEETFAEDFARFCNGDDIFIEIGDEDFFNKIIKEYSRLAFN